MADNPGVLAVRGGLVVDATGVRRADVLVEGGRVVAVEPDLDVPAGATVLDAAGCYVSPGLVDLHTHLREPGGEEAETVLTGSRAAARGGFTAVVAMPNTDPPIDCAAVVADVRALAADALCAVEPAAAITVGRAGERLAPLAELAALGVRWFTDDGTGVQDNRLMRRALEYASMLDVTLAQHCEDAALAGGGHLHEGEVSARLGIPGQPAEAEELMVMRDIALARLTGGRVHMQHLSTAGSVALVRAARAGGIPVSAEATPHHLALTHHCCEGFDPVFKVNPPLRTETDTAAVRAGLADGTIDAIATDHAPHPRHAKERPFDQAPPGMLGLEVALGVAVDRLDLPVERILGLLSWQPARLARLHDQGGPIQPGAAAHLCVFDPEERWVVDRDDTASRSRNNPWHGQTLTGRVRHTVYAGEAVVIDRQAQR